MSVHIDDSSSDHFKTFIARLEATSQKNEKARGDVLIKGSKQKQLLERQKNQVEMLIKLEKQFRSALIKHKYGPSVYRDFVSFICDKRKNILAARPYFRERQSVFTKRISGALKNRDIDTLYKFHTNYQFVVFVIKSRNWSPGSDIVKIANKIKELRTEMIEDNIPLAISRARIFFRKTPKAQLSFMDLVQIAAEGLMTGIDKFVPPFTAKFRGVLIGRMVGYFIEQYSETLIHFYPSDKRKIYRANKEIHKFAGVVDYDKLAESINNGMEGVGTTTPTEIAALMGAASTVSSSSVESSDSGLCFDVFSAPDDCRPDVKLENTEAMFKMKSALSDLSLFDKKLLYLKGIEIDL